MQEGCYDKKDKCAETVKKKAAESGFLDSVDFVCGAVFGLGVVLVERRLG